MLLVLIVAMLPLPSNVSEASHVKGWIEYPLHVWILEMVFHPWKVAQCLRNFRSCWPLWVSLLREPHIAANNSKLAS